MCTQLLLLFPQRRLLLATHRATGKYHHERLVARLLAVRRAARRRLVLLALERAVLLTPFAALFDRGDALGVVCFRLLPRAEDVVLGDECLCEVAVRRREERLLLRLKRGELPLRSTASTTLDRFARCLQTEVV